MQEETKWYRWNWFVKVWCKLVQKLAYVLNTLTQSLIMNPMVKSNIWEHLYCMTEHWDSAAFLALTGWAFPKSRVITSYGGHQTIRCYMRKRYTTKTVSLRCKQKQLKSQPSYSVFKITVLFVIMINLIGRCHTHIPQNEAMTCAGTFGEVKFLFRQINLRNKKNKPRIDDIWLESS